MIHRRAYPPYTLSAEDTGSDPYDSAEQDPQITNAIASSLWELETLQSHYHPTVASICRIISEQFTKQQYNLEDFLDHGYGTMMEAELKKKTAKEGKKEREPVVEWRIPKRVFVREEGEGSAEELRQVDFLKDFWEF